MFFFFFNCLVQKKKKKKEKQSGIVISIILVKLRGCVCARVCTSEVQAGVSGRGLRGPRQDVEAGALAWNGCQPAGPGTEMNTLAAAPCLAPPPHPCLLRLREKKKRQKKIKKIIKKKIFKTSECKEPAQPGTVVGLRPAGLPRAIPKSAPLGRLAQETPCGHCLVTVFVHGCPFASLRGVSGAGRVPQPLPGSSGGLCTTETHRPWREWLRGTWGGWPRQGPGDPQDQGHPGSRDCRRRDRERERKSRKRKKCKNQQKKAKILFFEKERYLYLQFYFKKLFKLRKQPSGGGAGWHRTGQGPGAQAPREP